MSDEIDTDLIFFPSPLPAPSFFGVLVGLAPNLPCVQGRARSFTRSLVHEASCLCVCLRFAAWTRERTDGQWRRNGGKTNERTNERNSGGKEIVNERGRRRNNIWPACKFPFGRKQAASRGGKARRGNTTKINVCIVTAAGQYPQLHYACYIPCYRRIDNYRPSKRRERKKERERKRKEVNPG